MDVCLHQFLYSHFNEKARWALACKRLPHRRQTYLPGPHIPKIRRLSGQTRTPVLTLDGEVVTGSAAIIDRLERDHPEPALYPGDPALRDEALALQARFDATVGPATRTALFSVLVHEGGYLTRMFARDASAPARALYRTTFPLARRLIARANGVTDPDNVARAFEITGQTLDEVAERTAATGYLCGDSFSVADLTAASLLAPLVVLDHPDMARPLPVPEPMAAFYARWQDHPAIDWVRHQYAMHRP
ncbi:MAG: glutathione S-transferase family protein [Pseudomonadales bacterium]